MIVFDLTCAPHGHRFEGWFASTEDFTSQHERGLVSCPQCGTSKVAKAPMAPAVPRKGNQLAEARPGQPVGTNLPPEAAEVLGKLAQLQAEALKSSRYVGEDFAAVSRAMHYGERETETVHGQASPEQARELLEEGVPLVPLPFPVAPPDKLN